MSEELIALTNALAEATERAAASAVAVSAKIRDAFMELLSV